MNKLISIGYLGIKYCYLNVDEDEAIRRYCFTNNISEVEFKEQEIRIDTIEFEDEFSAYEIWE